MGRIGDTGREDLVFSMECGTVLICDVSSLLLVSVGLLCPIHTTSADEISPFSTDSIHAFTSKAFFRRRFEKNIE